MSKKKKVIVFLLLMTIFFGTLLLFGVKEHGDSGTYREMRSFRDPLYGLILLGLDTIFGDRSNFVMGILQNVLAAIANYLLFCYIVEKTRIGKLFVQASILFAMLVPYVITPFFTSSRFIICNAIMTEGLIFPLYTLLVYLFLHLIWEEKMTRKMAVVIRTSIWLVILLMLLIRGQMLVTLIVWVVLELICFVRGLKNKNNKKNLIVSIAVILSIVILLGVKGKIIGYCNQVYNEANIQTTYGDITFLSNLVYVAEADSIEAVQDPTLQELYKVIYAECDSRRLLYQYAPKDLTEEAEFYALSHDEIKMEVMQEVFLQYLFKNSPNTNYAEDFVLMDEMSRAISKDIFPSCMKAWVGHYFKNVFIGLMRSVAVAHRFLYVPVTLCYILLIAMAIYLRKEEDKKIYHLFLLVTLMTAGMVSSISLVIMCLSRYMVYNMSFIYVAGILMIYQILSKKKSK